MAKNIITVGIGWGDEGKGATVDALCRHFGSKTVIRYSGGHQCAHNVVTPDGKSHVFSQFGAGTFARAKTFLLRDVVIEPGAMFNEAIHLEKLGVYHPFSMLYVHPKCVVTSVYHRVFNMAFATLQNTGTCGVGIGLTRYTSLRGVSINPRDTTEVIKDKLYQIRALLEDYYYNSRNESISYNYRKTVIKKLEKEYVVSVPLVAKILYESLQRVQINDPAYDDEYIIFEGAQGLGLNEYTGSDPSCSTWGNVTPRNAIEFLDERRVNGYSDSYHVMGVLRWYATRHGGSLPWSTLGSFTGDPGNPCNEFQGYFNAYNWGNGHLKKISEAEIIDSFALNHCDEAVTDKDLATLARMCDPDGGSLASFGPISVTGHGRTAMDRRFCDKNINFRNVGTI